MKVRGVFHVLECSRTWSRHSFKYNSLNTASMKGSFFLFFTFYFVVTKIGSCNCSYFIKYWWKYQRAFSFYFFLYIEPFVRSYKDRSELAILSNTDGIQSINKVYYILFHSILAEPSVANSFG